VKAGVYRPKGPFSAERGALVVPLGKEITWVELALNSRESRENH
jgi:hypothetical protein